jgi:hypothetical protein
MLFGDQVLILLRMNKEKCVFSKVNSRSSKSYEERKKNP